LFITPLFAVFSPLKFLQLAGQLKLPLDVSIKCILDMCVCVCVCARVYSSYESFVIYLTGAF